MLSLLMLEFGSCCDPKPGKMIKLDQNSGSCLMWSQWDREREGLLYLNDNNKQIFFSYKIPL